MITASNHDRTTPSSLQALVDTVEAYIAREKLSRTGFGLAALGGASILGRLSRGSDVRLDTADKVLACMKLEPIGPRFLRRLDAFLKVTGIKPHMLGEEAPGEPSFVLRLETGRSPMLRTVDKVDSWIGDNASPAELEAARAAVEDDSVAVPVDAEEHEESEMDENTRFMNTQEVAAYVGLSPRTLEGYRSRGGGPPFYVIGRFVRYLLSEVVDWVSARQRHSTSDDGLGSPAPEDRDEGNDDADSPEKSGDDGRRGSAIGGAGRCGHEAGALPRWRGCGGCRYVYSDVRRKDAVGTRSGFYLQEPDLPDGSGHRPSASYALHDALLRRDEGP